MQSSVPSGAAPPSGPALAVDIGGTKMMVAIVDDDGTIGWRERIDTMRTLDAEELFGPLAALVGRALAATAVLDVGVGCGGPMEDRNETVSPLNIPAWRGFPLRRRLAELTGRPVAVDNDAKALALAEGRWGAAQQVDDYISMVVSTGVGAGIVSDGRLIDGRTANGGHIGHVVVVPGGRQCVCGARGCLEAETSGAAIAAFTGRPAAEAGPDVVDRTGRLVGRAVGSVANLLDLRLATVAGSVALGYGDPFFAAAQTELDAVACMPYARGCSIAASGLGSDGPILGAAAVAFRARRS
ncbi:MAG TPA: ROK family protein [Acidimicrobiales bacterium]|jgi:glucokinase|nr:ROK family protein [Acidimicrobiales bacterium]